MKDFSKDSAVNETVYEVVSGNEQTFGEAVNRNIELGYKLQGGVSVSGGMYYQAMVMNTPNYLLEGSIM